MGGCYSRHAQFGGKNSQLRRYSEIDTDIAAVDDDTSNMPHPIGVSSADARGSPYKKTHGGFGFKKPYGGRYGGSSSTTKNDEKDTDVTYEPLGNRDPGGGSVGSLNKSKSKPQGGSKFGFMSGLTKRSKTEGNMAGSKESVTEEGVGHQKQLQQRGRPPSRGSSLKAPSAYKPKSDIDNWKMIDDCSSVYSGRSNDKNLEPNGVTLSNTGSVQDEAISEDLTNANVKPAPKPLAHQLVHAPIASMETLSGGSNDPTPVDHKSFTSGISAGTSSSGSGGGVQRASSKLRGPFARKTQQAGTNNLTNISVKSDKWVRASPTEGDSHSSSKQAPNGSSKSKSKPVSAKTNGTTSNSTSSSGPASFLKRGLLRKQKPVNESPKSSQGPKSAQSKEKVNSCASTPKVADSKTKTPQHSTEDLHSTSNVARAQKKVIKEVAPHVETVSTACVIPQKGRTQLPSIDALEVASIGSLCSDDLMLECDINLDEYDVEPNRSFNKSGKSSVARPRSRSRSGSRSRSRDSLDGKVTGIPSTVSAGCRKPPLCRYNTDSSVGYSGTGPRRHGSQSQDGAADEEPLQELASLMDKGVQRRPGSGSSRAQRPTRPNSFPGPGIGGTKARSASLDEPGTATTPTERPMMRPPRQAPSSVSDDDVITISGFTYRQLQQDLTLFKTMVLKLKRVIQEDEFGQAWKNGYKFTGSQPSSPMYSSKDESHRFSFSHETASETKETLPSSHSLMQENNDLRQQVQSLQQQLEKQDKVVKLLQQQMTKYECGYMDPAGREFNHTSTQTDSKLGGAQRRVGQGHGTGGGRNSPRGAQKIPRSLKPPSSSSSYSTTIQGSARQRQDVRLNHKQLSEQSIEDDVFSGMMCEELDSEPDLDDVLSDPELSGLAGSFGTSLDTPTTAPCLLRELEQVMIRTGHNFHEKELTEPFVESPNDIGQSMLGDFEEQFELELESCERLHNGGDRDSEGTDQQGHLEKMQNVDRNRNNVRGESGESDHFQDVVSGMASKTKDLCDSDSLFNGNSSRTKGSTGDTDDIQTQQSHIIKKCQSLSDNDSKCSNVNNENRDPCVLDTSSSLTSQTSIKLDQEQCDSVSNLQPDSDKPPLGKRTMVSQLPKKSRLPTFGIQKVQKSKLPSFNPSSSRR